MIQFLSALKSFAESYIIYEYLKKDPQVQAVIKGAIAKAGNLDMVSQQRLTAEIDTKVKSGWSREGAEASALWEAGIIDDDDFQVLTKALGLIK